MLLMGDMQFDETSCGPLCQHPQCWASNRRVERGLPRRLGMVSASKDDKESLEYGGLPTLKVKNILEDYGFSSAGLSLSEHQQAASGTTDAARTQTRQRSASAPSTKVDRSAKTQSRGGQSRRERNPSSRPPLLEPIQQQLFPPRLARVHLDQVCGPIAPLDDVRMGSAVYLWQPSEKSLRSIKTPAENENESTAKIISPRDITEALMPATIGTGEHSKKMRSKRNKQTPTGGRPYTHPLKSPPPIARRTLPADMDEGIAQLLSLPRDVILQIVEHTKESDLFDKEKVQELLARVMPHIRFSDSSRRLTPDLASSSQLSPPLHAMGLLRNRKMPILEGKQKFDKPAVPLQSLPRMPLVLDRSEVMTGSYKGGGDERQEHPRILCGGMPDVSHFLKNKVTSVSAKSLPPLLPGSKVTKPFHYTIQSLDLALTPLLTPENPPSSPRSENESSLLATFPTDPSEEHSLQSTAKHPHLAVMRQESPASTHHSHGLVDHSPSYSSYRGPYNARPYGSPGAFSTPNGTPVAYSTPGPTPALEAREGHMDHVTRMGSGSTTISRGTLQTIHESPVDTPDTLLVTASPSLKPRSVSPWENPARNLSQAPSVPSNPSPDVWPVVDEKSYLHSPENVGVVDKPEKAIPETVAPPPSPAPSVRSGMLEEDAVSTDGATTTQMALDCNQNVVTVDAERETPTEGGRVTDAAHDARKRALTAIKEDGSTDKELQGGGTSFPPMEGTTYGDQHVVSGDAKCETPTATKDGGVTDDNTKKRALSAIREYGATGKELQDGGTNMPSREGATPIAAGATTTHGESLSSPKVRASDDAPLDIIKSGARNAQVTVESGRDGSVSGNEMNRVATGVQGPRATDDGEISQTADQENSEDITVKNSKAEESLGNSQQDGESLVRGEMGGGVVETESSDTNAPSSSVEKCENPDNSAAHAFLPPQVETDVRGEAAAETEGDMKCSSKKDSQSDPGTQDEAESVDRNTD